MKQLDFDQMQEVQGGSCVGSIGAGVTGIFGLAVATSSTGVLAPLGLALAIGGLAWWAFDAIYDDPC